MKPHRNITCQLLHRDAPPRYHGGTLWSCSRCGSTWTAATGRAMRAGHAVGRQLSGRVVALIVVALIVTMLIVPAVRLIAS